MSNKSPKIMSLAAALAALTGTAAISNVADAKPSNPIESTAPNAQPTTDLTPNQILSVGQDLLGFIVTKAADGTVLAEHVSHYSHSSHSSHASHHSSRY